MRALPHLPTARPTDATSGAAGSWKLMPGRATRLTAWQAGELRITAGAAWITFDGVPAGRGKPVPAQDIHLVSGQHLALGRGQQIVLEPIAAAPGQARVDALACQWIAQGATRPRGSSALSAAARGIRKSLRQALAAALQRVRGALGYPGQSAGRSAGREACNAAVARQAHCS